MMRALLIGDAPVQPLGYEYVLQPPYEAVVIGSLTIAQLLHFREDAALNALAQGMPVLLYTPGLPDAPKNRSLSACLATGRRQLKNWGVVFTDGGQRRLITATQAQALRQAGQMPPAGAVLTPLAREILEGKA